MDIRLQIIPILVRSVIPPVMVVSILGNILNIIVLKRYTLFKHPCSRYFLALGTNNLFFSIFLLTFNLLANGYQLDPTSNSRLWCKIILYVQQTSVTISPYFIVLAAFDRYCASSSNVQRRNLSNLIFARWSITFVFVFFSLFFINSFILLDLQPDQAVRCRISTTTLFGRVYPVIHAVILNLIPPCFMLIFGILTIKNTKEVRVVPIIISSYRRTERQLVRMLLVQTACYVLLTTPMCVIAILGFLPVQYLSPIEFFFAFRITQLIFSLSYTTSVILYFLSSRVYRKEVINIIRNVLQFIRSNQIRTGHMTTQHIQMKPRNMSWMDKQANPIA